MPTRLQRDRVRIGIWMFALCFMVFVMVTLGGATRLTGSGLSIMEWAPLSGALPPLGEAEWRRLFDLYQTIPQYALLHSGMDLPGFRSIFWLEWTHRLWGRLMGVALLLPLLAFWWRGSISRALGLRLAGLFLLGGLQGAVGWFMVASGFAEGSIAVSAYRLVIHLGLALGLYAALLWTGLSVLHPARRPIPPRQLGRALAVIALCLALTIIAGGFVAGLHAGWVYNTYPLMDGRLVPEGYARLDPFWRNLTENVAAVQWNHRLLATITALAALGVAAVGLATLPRDPALRWALAMVGILVLGQYGLGIATLVGGVPVGLATAHQAGAVLLLTATLCGWHLSRRAASPSSISGEIA